jgi:hypothetical protein
MFEFLSSKDVPLGKYKKARKERRRGERDGGR